MKQPEPTSSARRALPEGSWVRLTRPTRAESQAYSLRAYSPASVQAGRERATSVPGRFPRACSSPPPPAASMYCLFPLREPARCTALPGQTTPTESTWLAVPRPNLSTGRLAGIVDKEDTCRYTGFDRPCSATEWTTDCESRSIPTIGPRVAAAGKKRQRRARRSRQREFRPRFRRLETPSG